jgi:hypothetical protein
MEQNETILVLLMMLILLLVLKKTILTLYYWEKRRLGTKKWSDEKLSRTYIKQKEQYDCMDNAMNSKDSPRGGPLAICLWWIYTIYWGTMSLAELRVTRFLKLFVKLTVVVALYSSCTRRRLIVLTPLRSRFLVTLIRTSFKSVILISALPLAYCCAKLDCSFKCLCILCDSNEYLVFINIF